MTLQEVYKKGTEMLREADIENPSVDAFYLLEYAAGIDKNKYLMFKDQQVKKINSDAYFELIKKRMTRIPYQYIINRADFAGLTFEVNENVLIPRLDTEVLFEHALRHLKAQAYVLDLCCGSGALGIALKRYRPDIHVIMSDISHAALDVAGRNIEHQHLEIAGQGSGSDLDFGIRLIEGDLFDALPEDIGQFDLIVSNPPYVSDSEYESLMPEVKNHEPKLALTAGADGLDIYRRIAADVKRYLKAGGYLLLEIGCSQAAAVTELLLAAGFSDIKVEKDMAGLDRVVIATA